MKNVRIGNDILLKIGITTNAQPQSLDGRALQLLLFDTFGIPREIPYSVEDGSVMVARFWGVDQKTLGTYGITVWENKGEYGQAVFDKKEVFHLTARTPDVEGQDTEGITTEVVEISGNMAIGIKGPSNYELAQSHGFTGTEEEYLASLHGKDFKYEDFTPEQIKVLQQPATEAAAETQRLNSSIAQSESARVAAETSRSNAESSRAAAETERYTAEDTRKSAEAARMEAETNRSDAEKQRAQTETARVSAESERTEAETARRNAESDRTTTFSALRTDSEQATASANAAAESANTAAQNAQNAADNLPKMTVVKQTNQVTI